MGILRTGVRFCLFKEVGLSSDPRGTALVLGLVQAPLCLVLCPCQQKVTPGPSQLRDSRVTPISTCIPTALVCYCLRKWSPQMQWLKVHTSVITESVGQTCGTGLSAGLAPPGGSGENPFPFAFSSCWGHRTPWPTAPSSVLRASNVASL